MKKMIKRIIQVIIKKTKNLGLWYQLVLKEHHNFKLPIYHKLRAIKYSFSSDFYYLFELNKNNPKDYMSDYQRTLTREINKNYLMLFDNKIVFEKVFSKYIPIPKTIMIIENGIYDREGNDITINSLNHILKKDEYIIKPTADTGGGMGVKLLKRINDNCFELDKKQYDSKELYNCLSKMKGNIVTEYIKQHQYSEKINPTSVNTIRIITLRDPNTNEYIIPAAVHRFGSKKSNVVDNASSGGFITNIDVETGTLLETKTFSSLESFKVHPDTHEKIYGTKIPHFEEIKKELLKTAKKFPYIPFIAWDVVVTEDSFSIIEINASSGLGIFQIFGSLKNTKLGDFYKHYGYFK